MHQAKWLLKLLGHRLATPVGVSHRMTTSTRPCSRLLQAGRWRQSKTSSQKGSLHPSARRAASPIGCPLSRMSRLLMHPANFTVARSRPTTPLGSAIGSQGSPRVTAFCLLRLLGSLLLLHPSSRQFNRSEPYMTSIPKSTELMSCSPAWPTTSTTDGNDSKK